MRYEVAHGKESVSVEVREVGPHEFEVSIDDGDPVRVDAFKTPRTVYSVLIDGRQYEGSVDELDDGTLDIHVGTGAFEMRATDERKKILFGARGVEASGRQELRAQMPGKIVKLLARVGDSVEIDQPVLVLEAMKMENEIKSPIVGSVTAIEVAEGDAVEAGQMLLVIEPLEGAE